MAKNQEHRADYSLEEMCELTGLTRKQFTDALTRVCEMYNIPITAFKTDETSPKSGYLFPFEAAEPLAVLVKNNLMHPLQRRNTDISKLSASAIAQYNKSVLADIENLSPYHRDVAYNLDGHLVSQEVSDWAVPLVQEFTYFLYNLATIGSESVGAALRTFTKKLNEMNYCLYRGKFIMDYAKKENAKRNKAVYGEDDELSDSAKILQQQNVSIDRLLAEVVRSELDIAYATRTKDLLSAERQLMQEIALYKVCGIGIMVDDNDECLTEADILNCSDEELRQLYCSIILKDTISQSRLKANKVSIQTMKENAAKWKPIEERIKDGNFTGLNHQPDEPPEVQKLLAGLNTGYVKYCEEVKKNTKPLQEIVDQFIGRSLNEFLSRPFDTPTEDVES